MILLDMRGQFLFQVRPDIFPEGRLTTAELELWALHYEEKQKKSTMR